METGARFAGVELYFNDLKKARAFYADTLGLQISDEDPQRYAKFSAGAGFICLERRGSESYPSLDKAVLFFEVSDLQAAIHAIGDERFVECQAKWACSTTRKTITFFCWSVSCNAEKSCLLFLLFSRNW